MSGNDKKEDIENSVKAFFQEIIGTEDKTSTFKEKERMDNKWMAMMSYIIPPIPFIAERHSGYVKFHSNQGMNMLIWYLLLLAFIMVIDAAFPWKFIVNGLKLILNLALVALVAFGIIGTEGTVQTTFSLRQRLHKERNGELGEYY